MIGNLNLHEIDQLLRTQQIGRLGLIGDGKVFVFPAAFGYDGSSLSLISREGQKVRLMRAHPDVCFEIEDITTPVHWRTVLVHGTFEELTEEAEPA
jgi:uncharacterized protein